MFCFVMFWLPFIFICFLAVLYARSVLFFSILPYCGSREIISWSSWVFVFPVHYSVTMFFLSSSVPIILTLSSSIKHFYSLILFHVHSSAKSVLISAKSFFTIEQHIPVVPTFKMPADHCCPMTDRLFCCQRATEQASDYLGWRWPPQSRRNVR